MIISSWGYSVCTYLANSYSSVCRVDSTIIIEALATGCVGTTAMLTIHNMCAGMIGTYNNSSLPRVVFISLITCL